MMHVISLGAGVQSTTMAFDLRSDAEIGQADLFLNECEGMCGV
jgi:hypothetical protein